MAKMEAKGRDQFKPGSRNLKIWRARPQALRRQIRQEGGWTVKSFVKSFKAQARKQGFNPVTNKPRKPTAGAKPPAPKPPTSSRARPS